MNGWMTVTKNSNNKHEKNKKSCKLMRAVNQIMGLEMGVIQTEQYAHSLCVDWA